MSQTLQNAHYLLSTTDPRTLGTSVAEVAFVGRSNSGKSTVLNTLCQQKNLARVSKTPGRTQTINVYETAHFRWLVDLPGYGFAVGPASSREGWMDMIEGYLTGRPTMRCIFMLVDAKVGATRLDFQMIQWLNSKRLPYRILGNKVDQVKPSVLMAQKQTVARSLNKRPEEIFWISGTKGIGIHELRQEVTRLLDL